MALGLPIHDIDDNNVNNGVNALPPQPGVNLDAARMSSGPGNAAGEQEGAAAGGGVTGGNIINMDESVQDQDNHVNNQTVKDDKDVLVYAN